VSDDQDDGTPSDEEAAAPQPDDVDTGVHSLTAMAESRAKDRTRRERGALTVERPGKDPIELSLEHGATIIGRDESCHIVLDGRDVSRRHARIERNPGGYFEVCDMGSRNGLRVAGAAVERMTLLDGDMFMIGETRFILRVRVDDAA